MPTFSSFLNRQVVKVVKNYLQPACNFFIFAGTKNLRPTTETQAKRGTQRSLTPEQYFLIILVGLRCGLLGIDIASLFEILHAQYSRIETTWLAYLYDLKPGGDLIADR